MMVKGRRRGMYNILLYAVRWGVLLSLGAFLLLF